MSIFLEPDDVQDLTGFSKKSKQAEWLDRRSWTYEISALGRIKILRKYAEMKLGMPLDKQNLSITEPDFTQL